jgi:carbon monoxide dehydrogenase subunit G
LIELTARFEAPPDRVWAELADLGSHVEWMADAMAIHFLTEETTGVGVQMRVPTKIGPFRANDLMTVVEWDEGRVIAVEHIGTVSGVGRFEILPVGTGTELRWTEKLRFPRWLGGPVGAWLAGPILRRIWRGNLRRLGERLAVSAP